MIKNNNLDGFFVKSAFEEIAEMHGPKCYLYLLLAEVNAHTHKLVTLSKSNIDKENNNEIQDAMTDMSYFIFILEDFLNMFKANLNSSHLDNMFVKVMNDTLNESIRTLEFFLPEGDCFNNMRDVVMKDLNEDSQE